ncbi:AbrB family transcriptional regulator [Paenibacillus protaetiae]|uniref:AbrB family transcriptional regulator n=1 Tax=Paenibacillus protaetiae TaxID=2509456 RepID=A0A4P6ETI0_9BACL|nr:AbrB family transcriptional regulator [Paenibacillus protaetiae]QAY66490.1 AbrB family transcriptional regulator [Paenibacillus protaetiae]
MIKRHSWIPILSSLIAALIGGYLFQLLHIPVPWLLGPMAFVLICSSFFPSRFTWYGPFRTGSMIIVGYTIGLSLTGAALKEIGRQLPFMLLMTSLLLLLCAGIAFIVSKVSRTDFKTALMGAIPGGLTQVLILAEETGGINMTVVTITQVIRLMMIVICIPLLVFSPLFDHVNVDGIVQAALPEAAAKASWSGLFPNAVWYAAVCILFAYAGRKVKLPTAFLLGPVIGAALLQGLGVTGPGLPVSITDAAQLSIGIFVGLMLKPGQLPNKTRTLLVAIGSGLLLLLAAILLSLLLTLIRPVSAATGLLSLAPGGADQMGIIAHEIGADLSIVAGYQLFRTFFILIAFPPLWRLLFVRKKSKNTAEQGEA